MNIINIAIIFSEDNDKQKEFAKKVFDRANDKGARLIAVINPIKSARESYGDIIASGVKFFSSLNAMYEKMNIDLVIVASHAGLHSMHASMAMENGSHVLIVKPFAGCMEDANEIIQMAKLMDKKVLVGYESLYDDSVRKIKEIILSSHLGGLIDMKMICLIPKSKSYFNDGLSGKICDASGRLVMDSVANSDAANHILNLLYFAGNELNTVGQVDDVDAALYKTHEIETFDSCAIKVQLEGDIGLLAIASQVINSHLIKYMLWFERGYIEYDDLKWKIYDNSTVELQDIGPMVSDDLAPVWEMIDYINDDNKSAFCSLEGVAEHVGIVDRLSNVAVNDIDEYGESLEEKLLNAYNNYCLPDVI